MPSINAIAYDLENREIKIVDILALISCPPDDLPFVSTHAAVAALVGTGEGPHAFRAEDFLGVTTVWLHANTAALVFFFYRRQLVLADLVLMGESTHDDATALRWATQRLSMSFVETRKAFNRKRPTLARFLGNSSDAGNADLISLLVVVPVLCELNQVS